MEQATPTLIIPDKVNALVDAAEARLDKLPGYIGNRLRYDLDVLKSSGAVEVGYRQQCGATHVTMKAYREWVKIVAALQKNGIPIEVTPVTHGNAYATSNGGFWNSNIYKVSL